MSTCYVPFNYYNAKHRVLLDFCNYLLKKAYNKN